MNKTAKTAAFAISSIALAAALAACGGGGGSSSNPTGQTSSTGQTGSTGSTPQPISLLAATGAAAGSPTLTGDAVADSFAYANNKRAQLGLSQLKQIAAVNTAAGNHATYMYDANAVGHYETAGQPGFTGVAPSDRVKTAGYTTNSVGEIAAGIGGPFTSSTEAVDGLFDAPFHRAIFLFDTTGVGFGQGPANTDPAKYSTLVGDFVDYVQQTPDYKLVAYPYNGQTNVKPSWIANESPNPMSFYAAAPTKYVGATVGYPVTLSAAGNGAFSNIAFTIADAPGNAVPCQEVDNTTTSEAQRLAMCVPFAPLAANTTYKVTVTGSLTNTSIPQATAFSVNWSFTTGASAAVQARQLPAGSSTARPPVFN
ncbi:CAP domain-containing protein [Paraburkholderia sediminicola]|uniref:CAP domain-containing protein n=1 Tax=Paraburkholderia sediminicola TaxID=458836 RepID=UPI0038BA1FE5